MMGIFSLDMELASELHWKSLIHHAYTVPTPSKRGLVGVPWVPIGGAKIASSVHKDTKNF